MSTQRPGIDMAAASEHLSKKDKLLGKLIERVGPCTMKVEDTSSLFFALAQSIVYQQLSGKAAATIFGRVCALDGQGLSAERLALLPDEKLRGAGLSAAKTLALRDLARRSVEGALPTLEQAHAMDDEALIEKLVAVRGIGRWTVEMLLMFRLGRPDVLPVDDYGVRKGFAVAFKKRELPTRAELAKRGARWSPYRTVASWYLWRAAELPAASK